MTACRIKIWIESKNHVHLRGYCTPYQNQHVLYTISKLSTTFIGGKVYHPRNSKINSNRI